MTDREAHAFRNLVDTGERRSLDVMMAAELPRCTPKSLGVDFTVRAEHAADPEAERARADALSRLGEYLSAFADHDGCVCCGAVLGGNERNIIAAFIGTFEWALAYGEGRCGRCGYPARAIHRVDLGDAGELELPRILQYHPSTLSSFTPRGEVRP